MGLNQYERRIAELLREGGAALVAQGNHLKYRFPDGRHIVLSSTPSDWRASRNKLKELEATLGVRKEAASREAEPPPYEPKPPRRKREYREDPPDGPGVPPLRSLFSELLTKVKISEEG